MKFRYVLLSSLAVLLCAASLSAQNPHTWVSGSGNDTSNTTCSFTAPCATFANALANTSANGIVTAKDTGDFGPVTITQSVTIDGANMGSISFSGSGSTGISITASANVVVRNLTINGLGSGNKGIVASGGTVIVDNCKIINLAEEGYGISFSGQGTLYVKNSQLEFMGFYTYGIQVGSNGAENIVVNNTLIDASNYNYGFVINAGTGPVIASLQNVTILSAEIAVVANSGLTDITGSMLIGSTRDSAQGVVAGSGATVSVASSLITGNSAGGVCSNTGGKIRLDNNDIYDNTTAIANCGGIVKTSTTNKTSGTISIPAADVSDSVTF